MTETSARKPNALQMRDLARELSLHFLNTSYAAYIIFADALVAVAVVVVASHDAFFLAVCRLSPLE